MKKAPANTFERMAKVSNNESAINYKLELLNLNIMEAWDVALEKYVMQLKDDIYESN